MPGVLFIYILGFLTKFNLFDYIKGDNEFIVFVTALVIYFCVGVFVNRAGSMILSVKRDRSITKDSDWYEKYLYASDKDTGVEKLLIMKELYKSLFAVFFITPLIFILLTEKLEIEHWLVLVVDVLVLQFIYAAYKRQSSYLTKRIEARTKGMGFKSD